MAIPSQTFQQSVSAQVASWSASLGFQPTLQRGDSMFALMQMVAGQIMFLQAIASAIDRVARAQTSTGADLDSFYAQFRFYRLPATYATTIETFSMASPAGADILIPAGSIVQTVGGTIKFQVVADTNQPTWNATLNAYVMAAGQTSLTATVQALVAGSGSNVGPNTLTQIASAISVDYATNGAAVTNGIDAESDAAFRDRFVLYLNSLSKAIKAAIESAIRGVQQGIQYNLLENENSLGVSAPGQFTAVIDDGSGAPPASLITAVQTALEDVRGFTILANVVADTVVVVTIDVAIRPATGYTLDGLTPSVQAAIASYVNSTPIGGIDGILVYLGDVSNAAKVTGVTAVQPGTLLINGAAADLAGTSFQAAKVSVNSITVGQY